MGRGDCCALYFMMENIGYEWYNQNVKDMDKSGVIGGMTNDKKEVFMQCIYSLCHYSLRILEFIRAVLEAKTRSELVLCQDLVQIKMRSSAC